MLMNDSDPAPKLAQFARRQQPGTLLQDFDAPVVGSTRDAKDPQQRRLAGARSTDDRNALAWSGLQRNAR
jgi:hypothetical protein